MVSLLISIKYLKKFFSNYSKKEKKIEDQGILWNSFSEANKTRQEYNRKLNLQTDIPDSKILNKILVKGTQHHIRKIINQYQVRFTQQNKGRKLHGLLNNYRNDI